MQFFDTHAHLDAKQFTDRLDHYLDLASEAGVAQVCAVATDRDSSLRSLQLAEKYPQICASVGVHPNYCLNFTESQWKEIETWAGCDDIVAIGETGLDLYWDYCPLEIQQQWFSRHIELSFATQKPLIIHIRETEKETVDLLADHLIDGKILGVLHSFAGSEKTAKQCLEWGMYISFSGILTYKNSDELRQVAAGVPPEKSLIETDSPYLSPHPYRGQRPNHPAMVRCVAECLAEIHGCTLEQIANVTTDNARRFFGIS